MSKSSANKLMFICVALFLSYFFYDIYKLNKQDKRTPYSIGVHFGYEVSCFDGYKYKVFYRWNRIERSELITDLNGKPLKCD